MVQLTQTRAVRETESKTTYSSVNVVLLIWPVCLFPSRVLRPFDRDLNGHWGKKTTVQEYLNTAQLQRKILTDAANFGKLLSATNKGVTEFCDEFPRSQKKNMFMCSSQPQLKAGTMPPMPEGLKHTDGLSDSQVKAWRGRCEPLSVSYEYYRLWVPSSEYCPQHKQLTSRQEIKIKKKGKDRWNATETNRI